MARPPLTHRPSLALRLLAAGAACLFCLPALAAPDAAPRPRVALVLSGGGARGFAHIGVLRVLREMHVPIDIVVGTSMGGVVGGAYAAGTPVEQIEDLARNTDWERVITDRPSRDTLVFRRREEDVLLPSRIEFGVHSDLGVTAPPSAADNASLELAMARLLPPGTRDTPVNALALPFRTVASDLVTGELVELAKTPLFMAMRASMAVPGVFAPVRVDGHLVADGGLVRNLPVDMAHEMGADIVIAVNVGTPLAPEKSLGSAVGVAQQMLNILTEQNVQRSLKELQQQDVLIAPNLDGVGFLDFDKAGRAITAGEQATRQLRARLEALAVTADQYAQFEHKRLAAPAAPDPALPIRQVQVDSVGRINPKTLEVQSGLKEGASATQAEIRRQADSLYGRGDIARVDTEIRDDNGARDVSVRAVEDSWANSRVRVGLELGSDFDDANSFALKLMHVRSSINDYGAELRSVLRVGDQRGAGVQYWQPLSPGSKWYVAPSVQYGSQSNDIFSDGRRLARTGLDTFGATMVLGRELGNWGDVQVGATRQRARVQMLIPQSDQPAQYVYDSTHFVRYRIDTLDSLAFPTRGVMLNASLERSPASGQQPTSLATSSVTGMAAVHTTNWAGHIYAEWARAQHGSAPLALGGFLRLSGTPADSVEGQRIAFGRVVLARKIGALPLTIGGTVHLGFSLEAGGAYDGVHPLRANTVKQSGSAFLSLDTRFGPAYFGAGATREGDKTLYLYLGPIW